MCTARRRRILLTGATGTLGATLAMQLCGSNVELILPVRSNTKASSLKKQLLAVYPDAALSFPMLDLADEASVCNFTAQLLQENQPLDALILNAGVFTKGGLTTPQGHEWHMQVNCLAQLQLARNLLPLLHLSPAPCVLAVTSLAAFWFRDAGTDKSPTRLYAASKRALLKELQTLSRLEPELCICYAHPGICATGLFRGNTHETAYPCWLMRMALPLMERIFPTPEKACRPILHALENPARGQLTEPGGLFHVWGRPVSLPLEHRLKNL